MQLFLQSQQIGDVVVIRCRGRIVTGDEARSLQCELEKLTPVTKKIVLQLAEVSYVDSGGLGALVRLSGILRAVHGELKLCGLSPFLLKVLQATNLSRVFHTYASEREALEAFCERRRFPEEVPCASTLRVVCVDTSADVLAYLRGLLTQLRCEVFTTEYLSDAMTLVTATTPRVVICGPGMRASEQTIEKLRRCSPNAEILLLQPDFSTAEASEAGLNLVNRMRSLLKSGE